MQAPARLAPAASNRFLSRACSAGLHFQRQLTQIRVARFRRGVARRQGIEQRSQRALKMAGIGQHGAENGRRCLAGS